MLIFCIFRVFFSHQHVQMITGPHEKSGVEKIFGDPFLTLKHKFENNFRKPYFQKRTLDGDFTYYFMLKNNSQHETNQHLKIDPP